MEITVKIEAPELAEAINNLAAALRPVLTPAFTDEVSVNKSTEKKAITPPSVPVAQAPQYTVKQLMEAGAYLMDAGKIEELRNLIASFNVKAVTNLAPEQFGAFATELRKLGAKI